MYFSEFEFDGFSQGVIKSMIAMLDVDRSGKLGLSEFVKLWKNIRLWKVRKSTDHECSLGLVSSRVCRSSKFL